MLIAIAGPDGAGKSTLSKTLAQALRRRGFDAVRLDRFDILDAEVSPASVFIAADVLTVRQAVLAMPSASARLLFILWSIATTVSQVATGDPDRIIIHDSYWMKHTAAEIIFGADEQAALAVTSLLPRPDLVFHFKVPAETLLARKPDDRVPYECGMDPLCAPESFLSHQRKIQSLLEDWSRREGWLEVDGQQPLEQLEADLIGHIEAHLLNRQGAARARALT
jgi:thymidylate kinase